MYVRINFMQYKYYSKSNSKQKSKLYLKHEKSIKWAATWQNQQCGCAPSEDSDQPGHSTSLIRVFGLAGCPGWSEYSLDAQPQWLAKDLHVYCMKFILTYMNSYSKTHCHFVGFVMRRLKYRNNVYSYRTATCGAASGSIITFFSLTNIKKFIHWRPNLILRRELCTLLKG